jgi:formamidopyrimidine-DNA glycosylase
MPELPEVETVVRELRAVLPGRTVVRAALTAPDLLRAGSEPLSALAGLRVGEVRRRGKAILVSGTRAEGDPADADVLVVHLGMTGRLTWLATGGAGAATGDHLHARWIFSDGSELRYHDPRRFGFLFAGSASAAGEALRIGPDPFEITPAELARRLAGRRAPLKALLLDQRLVSGLGNIYVDESLYLVRLHPLLPGDRAARHAAVILAAARRVLARAIRARGTTLRDYRRPDGATGEFQVRLRVYGRDGDACARCGRTIVKSTVAGRGTHHCPGCQRRPRVSVPSRRTRSAGRSRRAAPRRAGYRR